METMYETLLQLPLFLGLCVEDFTNIIEKIELHFANYQQGKELIHKNDECEQLCFLIQGELSVVTTSTDEKFSIIEKIKAPYVIEPYSLFGLRTQYRSSYISLTEASTICIPKNIIIGQLLNYPIFRLNFLNILSNRTQSVYNLLWINPKEEIEDIFAQFILTHSENFQGKKTLNIRIKDLALYLFRTRIKTSNALNHLQQLGLIEMHRREIIIPDINQLIHWRIKENQHDTTQKATKKSGTYPT
ncbi:MAG: Crp/Fnr family transcriptional regulator [Bacteroidaceae bacterium]|nr:Crp/Fnr family transcriptional regulator [Bacteroidaceae bacterium]